MKRLLPLAACLALLHLPTYSGAALLPYPSPLPKVSTPYDTILPKTWQGIKKRNVDAFTTGLIHRPKSEVPGDAVSEGVGYGMILALYANDQAYFNKIWDGGEKYMWNGSFYDWRVNQSGSSKLGTGAASDAEEDIACMLIFADQLVKKGIWSPFTSSKGATYASRAQDMVNSIWTLMVEDGKYLDPGAGWGGREFVNPGYFAPAFYRIFKEFDSNKNRGWDALIDQCYLTISLNPGYSKGMVPDWMAPNGEFVGPTGYNAYGDGRHLFKDAIRVHWRLATDYLWYGEPRAKAFADNALRFLQTPERSNFYTMEGELIPPTDTFVFAGGTLKRPRREHSHLTIGMWACAAMASGGPELAQSYSDELLKFYTPGNDFWGKASDPNGEDTLHNEMYFDQFLAWFGAATISGNFTNVWEDFKGDPLTPLIWKTEPTFSGLDINADISPLRIQGLLSKPARWTVELRHEDTDSTFITTVSSDTLDLLWYGLSSTGKPLPQGIYTVKISVKGLSTIITQQIWLGKALDLKQGNRLLIDDFKDGDFVPYIGKTWTSYLDSHDSNGKSTVTELTVARENNEAVVRWGFNLMSGSYPGYAALEWNCTTPTGNLNLNGLDTLVVVAKSQSPLGLEVHFITTDITNHTFFSDSLYLTTNLTEYRLPVSGFKQRLSGSGATLDLSKCTAIRFHVQGPDGMANTIIIDKMFFTGNLGALYQSPPEYIPNAVISANRSYRLQGYSLRAVNGGIRLTVPSRYAGAEVLIASSSGRIVARERANANGEILWNGKGRTGAGLYLAVVKAKGQTLTIPLHVMH